MRTNAAAGLVAALGIATSGLLAACGDDISGSTSYVKAACDPGTMCSWAGIGKKAFNGDGHERWATALYWPMDVEVAPDGRVYVIDWQNHRVRRVNTDDKFETVIGTDEIGDGPPIPATERTAPGVLGTTINLNHPTDLVFAPDGTMVLAAWHNHKIRAFDPATGLVDVTCGAGPGYMPPGDGVPAAMALMNQPKSVVVDPAGVIYLLDTRNLRIRRIDTDANRTITTVVGTGTRGFAGDGGPALMAQFSFQKANDNPEPGGALAMDASGRLYIVDTENQRVRRVDFTQDLIETVAGNGQIDFSGDGGPATEASLNYPRDVEIDASGNIYIADTDNHRVRRVDATTGIITTVAGTGTGAFDKDDVPPVEASLNRPFGIALDPQGNIYIADTFNNRIRKVTR